MNSLLFRRVSKDLVVKPGLADRSSRSGNGRRGSRRRIGLFTLHVPHVLDVVDELKRPKMLREVLAGATEPARPPSEQRAGGQRDIHPEPTRRSEEMHARRLG